jgi:hypothetical protein
VGELPLHFNVFKDIYNMYKTKSKKQKKLHL